MPPIPDGARHVWLWWLELASACGIGFANRNPIGYQDILAWSRLTGHRPDPWEIALIREIDNLDLSMRVAAIGEAAPKS